MAMSLTVSVDDAGRVSVTGPLENQMVCYGLLEIARDAIQKHCEQAAQAAIQPASPSDMLALRRKP